MEANCSPTRQSGARHFETAWQKTSWMAALSSPSAGSRFEVSESVSLSLSLCLSLILSFSPNMYMHIHLILRARVNAYRGSGYNDALEFAKLLQQRSSIRAREHLRHPGQLWHQVELDEPRHQEWLGIPGQHQGLGRRVPDGVQACDVVEVLQGSALLLSRFTMRRRVKARVFRVSDVRCRVRVWRLRLV